MEGTELVSAKLGEVLKGELGRAIDLIGPCMRAALPIISWLQAPGRAQGGLAAQSLECFFKAGAEKLHFFTRQVVDLAISPASAVATCIIHLGIFFLLPKEI